MKVTKIFLIASIVAVLSACAGEDSGFQAEPDNGIVNGHPVTGSNPLAHMVVALVAREDQGQALCTGTILTDDLILTAAHCVSSATKQMAVVFAENAKKPGKDHVGMADHVRTNPAGDLAVVHFLGGLPNGYRPVQLAKTADGIEKGTPVVMIGYGVTNGLSHSGAGVLRTTQTTILGRTGNAMVSDGSKSSACFGDSGGPAFVKIAGEYLQMGVAHSVSSEGCNRQDMHTLVPAYFDWIRNTVAALK